MKIFKILRNKETFIFLDKIVNGMFLIKKLFSRNIFKMFEKFKMKNKLKKKN